MPQIPLLSTFRKVFTTAWFIIAMSCFALPAYSQTSTISGTLTLPASVGNAVGDYNFSVIARVANGSGSQVSATGDEIIFDGTNSTPFTITVPNDPDPGNPNEQWRIDYVCNLNPSTNDCDNIAPNGSYDGADSVNLFTNDLLLDVATDHTGLVFPVIAADIITGTISLPGNLVAPAGGTRLTLRVLDSGGSFPLTDIVTIPQGQSSIPYQLNVATNGSATRRVFYVCDAGCDGLFDRGYYVSNTEMTTELNDATPLSGGGPQNNINLVVIPTNSISGILSLPSPLVSPVGGMDFRMTARPVGSVTGASVQTITIAAGADQRQFDLNVVGNAGGVWRVFYDCLTNCDSVVDAGFYNTSLTSIVFSEGTELAAAQDHPNIDIEVLDFKSVSGLVSLPAGTANGDINLTVRATTSNFSVNEPGTITIANGTSGTNYQIDVPKQSRDLTVRVTCNNNCDDLAETVFYNSAGTTVNSADAEGIAGTTDHTNINVDLISPTALIGTIGLPGSDNAATDIELRVTATTDDESQSTMVPVTIVAGTNSANFDVAIAPITDRHWLLDYECLSGCDGFVNVAYFADSSTTPNPSSARQFNGDRVENLNFDLLPGNAITGTVSFPNALSAPSGGTEVNIIGVDTNGVQATQILTINIDQDSNSAPYQIDVPVDNNAQWRLRYQCNTGCEDILDFGFFSESGTTGSSDSATLLSGNEFPHAGKNITMRPKRLITGELTLANGEFAAPGGMQFVVRATDVTDEATSFSTTETIDAGTSSTSYGIETESAVGSSWRISYICVANCSGFSDGFFSNTVSSGTVPVSADATPIAGGVDQADIDMEVLASNSIIGTLSLPGSLQAGPGGFTVNLDALDSVNGGNANTSVTIAEGESSSDFLIEVRPDPDAEWRVRYTCFDLPVCEGFLDTSFYSSNGMVMSSANATPLAGAQDHSSIDLEMVGATTFSGTLSLPGDLQAPAGGIELDILARGDSSDIAADSVSVVIPENGSSVDYAVDVPIDSNINWTVGYKCTTQCDGFFENGFFTAAGTVPSSNAATEFDGGSSQSGIDMELLTAIEFSGNLSIPGLASATGNIDLTIFARDIDTGFQSFTNITIGSGTQGEDFEIDIPGIPDSSFSLRYSCNAGCDDFVSPGYRKAGEPSVLTEEEATKTALGSTPETINDINGLDFSLIGENAITGMLVLPNSQSANGDISLTITLNGSGEGNNTQFTQDVTISDGASDSEFGFMVPGAIGDPWVIRYDCNSNCLEFVAMGFYNASGSVLSADDATLLPAAQNHNNLVFDIIPKREVSGTLQLPGAAEAGDIDFIIDLERADESFATSMPVTITAGTTSVDFSFLQDPEPDQSWLLGYRCVSNCDGRAGGYFATGGTTAVPGSATTLNGTDSFIDRDMTVLPSLMLEGQISRPAGDPATTGNIEFAVIALDTVNDNLRAVSEPFIMDSGVSSIPYRLNLPNVPSANWAILYFCATNCPEQYFNQGFFAGPGQMRAFIEGAQRLSITENTSGIDMTVLEKFFISGTIQLLEGRVAPGGGTELNVGAFDINGGSGSSTAETSVTIAAGTSEINYQFQIPGDALSEWRVSYRCDAGCAESLVVGFYASEGTTPDSDAATLLAGARSHTNIDLLVLDEDAEFNNDDDGDGVLNNMDNCRFVPNADQADSNSNGIGDVCDATEDFCFPIVTSSNALALICL